MGQTEDGGVRDGLGEVASKKEPVGGGGEAAGEGEEELDDRGGDNNKANGGWNGRADEATSFGNYW